MDIVLANLKPEGSARILGFDPLEATGAFDYIPCFPIGLGLIAACLKSHGYDYTVIDTYVSGDTDSFLNYIEKTRPKVLMLSGIIGNYSYAYIKYIAKVVKNISPEIIIILGGSFATIVPHFFADKTVVDYIVVGEGEETTIELLDALKNKRNVADIAGIFLGKYRGNSFTTPRQRLKTLSLFPDYDSFDMDFYLKHTRKANLCWEISSSRGCYGSCTFCKLTFGKHISSYCNEHLVDHIACFQKKYDISKFNFVDDNFLNTSARVDSFIEEIERKNLNIRWRSMCRMDRIKVEEVPKYFNNGMFDVSFGLESGSQRTLDVYNKRIRLSDVIEKLMKIREFVSFYAAFIVGGPGET